MVFLSIENTSLPTSRINRVGNFVPGSIEYAEEDLPADFLATFSLGKYIWDNATKRIVEGQYTPPPDWNKFLDSLGKQPTVAVKVAGSLLGAILMIRIQRLAGGNTRWEGAEDTLITCWNASNINLSKDETVGLNALAESADLPVRLVDGKLEVV